MRLILAVICASLIALSSGARYVGKFAADAGRILDKSQGIIPVGSRRAGIPRAYAVGVDSGTNSYNSLQDHSRYFIIVTGFSSRAAQDDVVHRALLHRPCQFEMFLLNVAGRQKQSCTVQASDMLGPAAIAEEWYNGNFIRSDLMTQVTIEMGHFQGQHNNPDADVHIQSVIPVRKESDTKKMRNV